MPLLFADRQAERTREAAGWVIAVLGGFGVSAVLSISGEPRQYFAGAWYMLVIAVASLVGGWRAGALAVITAMGGILWAVLPPRRELTLSDPGDAGALAAFVTAAIVLVVLVRSRDRTRRLAEQRATRSAHLSQLGDALSRAAGVEEVVGATLDWCRDSLAATRSLLTLSFDEGHGSREEWWSGHHLVDDELRHRADELFEHGGTLVDRTGVIAARLSAPAGPVGALVVDLGPEASLDEEDAETLSLAATSIGHAVARGLLFERQHAVADQIQQALLPTELPRVGGYQLRSWFQPSRTGGVAGDFYDVVVDGERWTAIVGDVCGTGVPAATIAAAARHTFRAAALDGRPPEETVRLIDRTIGTLAEPGAFCTAVVATGRHHGGEATVVVAGHPAPVVVRHDGRVDPVVAAGTILGTLAELGLDPTMVHLDPGDTLVVYTDGLADTPDGEEDVARRLAGASPSELPLRLGALRSPSGADDVAVLALTRR